MVFIDTIHTWNGGDPVQNQPNHSSAAPFSGACRHGLPSFPGLMDGGENHRLIATVPHCTYRSLAAAPKSAQLPLPRRALFSNRSDDMIVHDISGQIVNRTAGQPNCGHYFISNQEEYINWNKQSFGLFSRSSRRESARCCHRWHVHSCCAGGRMLCPKLLARSYPQPSTCLQGPGTCSPLVI